MRKWANRPSSRWKWLFSQWEGANQFPSAPISDVFLWGCVEWGWGGGSAAKMESEDENCSSCRLAEIKVTTLMTRVRRHDASQKYSWDIYLVVKSYHLSRISAADLLLWETEMGWGWSSCAVERCRMNAGRLWGPPLSDDTEVLGSDSHWQKKKNSIHRKNVKVKTGTKIQWGALFFYASCFSLSLFLILVQ